MLARVRSITHIWPQSSLIHSSLGWKHTVNCRLILRYYFSKHDMLMGRPNKRLRKRWHGWGGHAGEGTTEHLEQEKVRVPGMVTLRQGSYTLGRSEPSDIVLEVPTVSARHAQLEVGERMQSKCTGGWKFIMAMVPRPQLVPNT